MVEPSAKFNLLAVDDSEDIVDLIELTLRADCNVRRALDGGSALQLALEKPRPDLILLDVEMPGANGYEVCKALKANPALADVPVIFLTQRGEAQDVIKGSSSAPSTISPSRSIRRCWRRAFAPTSS